MGTLQEEFATTNSTENTETIIQIKNGKLFVNGEETSNPELIGFAVLDIVEQVIEGTIIDIQKF
ncbi:hypothetical protein [Myroides odoratus]|uniref:hypothetical protein n=1 Tax=Myroides odoratus TaxID=256 RepID=UPI0007660328|nr:hypothetical protein [Myroides odoratus]